MNFYFRNLPQLGHARAAILLEIMKVKVVSRHYLTPTDSYHWVFKYIFPSRINSKVISHAETYMSLPITKG